MKRIAGVALVACLAVPAWCATYSWIDESGTYNYSEDLSRVPKKYRKQALKRAQENGEVETEAVAPARPATPAAQEKAARPATAPPATVQPSAVQGGANAGSGKAYGGRSAEEWRAQLAPHEAELTRMEQRLALLRDTLNKPEFARGAERERLVTEHNDLAIAYKDKYAEYSKLVDAARAAGLPIQFKK